MYLVALATWLVLVLVVDFSMTVQTDFLPHVVAQK
jgi:hypothetical protein